jgi:hypothetical protein
MLMLSRELQSVRPHFSAVDGRYKDDRRTAVEQSLYPSGELFVPARSHAVEAGGWKRLICSGFIGERGGTRTLDPMIKSHVLYRLSYALT